MPNSKAITRIITMKIIIIMTLYFRLFPLSPHSTPLGLIVKKKAYFLFLSHLKCFSLPLGPRNGDYVGDNVISPCNERATNKH